MTRKGHTEEQIIAALQQAEAITNSGRKNTSSVCATARHAFRPHDPE
jgi:hypothetical protein